MTTFFFSRFFWMLAFGTGLVFQNCTANEVIEEFARCFDDDQLPEWMITSYTAGTGLGYSVPYSSLGFFLAPPSEDQQTFSFLDLKGHLFNNGMEAANAGLGIRYFDDDCPSLLWGLNLVYDYYKNTRHTYNQIGAGFEIMSERWDFHLNAYVPIGDKRKDIYRFNYDFFKALKNDDPSLLQFGLRAREQFALNGIDTLFGYRFCNWFANMSYDLRISAGPYFYWGRSAKTKNAFAAKHVSALGGRLKTDISLNQVISLSGIVTYDSLYKWCGQGVISLNIPFGALHSHFKAPSYSVKNRIFDSIERNEIIVIDSLTRFTNDPRVLDPEFEP